MNQNQYIGIVMGICVLALVHIVLVVPLTMPPKPLCEDANGWTTKVNNQCVQPRSIMDY